jgi:hypothetical protein
MQTVHIVRITSCQLNWRHTCTENAIVLWTVNSSAVSASDMIACSEQCKVIIHMLSQISAAKTSSYEFQD